MSCVSVVTRSIRVQILPELRPQNSLVSHNKRVILSKQDGGAAVAMEPVICDDLDDLPIDVGSVVPCKMGESPVIEIKHRWRKTKKGEQNDFKKDPRWRSKIRSFLEELIQRPLCINPFNPQRPTNCTCLSGAGALTEEVKDVVVQELFDFALLDYQSTQLLVLSWTRYSKVLIRFIRGTDRLQLYILPGTRDLLVCRSVVSTLIGFGKKAWY